jgi:hypothetical protein
MKKNIKKNTYTKAKLLSVGLIIVLLISTILFFAVGNSDKKKQEGNLMKNMEQFEGINEQVYSGDLAESFGNAVVYEVTEIVWEGDTGVAKVEIKAPDLEWILPDGIRESIEKYGTEDYATLLNAVKEYVIKKIESGRYKTTRDNIEMQVKRKEDGGYSLISDDEFEKIISGKWDKIYMSIVEGVISREWW